MTRIWMMGFGVVAAIAALKTAMVVHFAFPDVAGNMAAITGFFAFFFALTSIVAYVSFNLVRTMMERARKEKLAPGAGEPVAKETVVLRYANDWGLSQAEADVAIFVAKGFSNGEIADMRGCAIATVKSQLGRIYQKSGLDSRYQLIAFVTDEVCVMANESEAEKVQHNTQTVLRMVGRAPSAA